MSTLTNLWMVTKGYHKGAKVMEHQFSDGSYHYTFRDRLGRPDNIKNNDEAQKIIESFKMEVVDL